MVALEYLLGFVTKSMPTWNSDRHARHTGLRDLVAAITTAVSADTRLAKAETHFDLHSTNSTAPSHKEGKSFASGAGELLLQEMNTPSFAWLEDRLTAFRDGRPPPPYPDAALELLDKALCSKLLPWWYRPIRDIMMGDCSLLKRVLLKAVKGIPCTISLYLVDLSKHFDAYFNLHLVWGEQLPLTSTLLQFQPKGKVAETYRLGKLDKVGLLQLVWAEERLQVRRATDSKVFKREH